MFEFSGGSVGGVLFALLTQYLLDEYGYRSTLLINGGLYLHCFPLTLICTSHPKTQLKAGDLAVKNDNMKTNEPNKRIRTDSRPIQSRSRFPTQKSSPSRDISSFSYSRSNSFTPHDYSVSGIKYGSSPSNESSFSKYIAASKGTYPESSFQPGGLGSIREHHSEYTEDNTNHIQTEISLPIEQDAEDHKNVSFRKSKYDLLL